MFYSNFVVLLITILFLSYAQTKYDDTKTKTSAIEEIVQKVGNITIDKLAQAPDEEKSKIIEKIEAKLKKTAWSLGRNENKYVKFIMSGIKAMSCNDSKQTENNKFYLRTANVSYNKKTETVSDIEPKAEVEAIKDIATKIEILAKKYLRKAKTPADKQSIIQNIKRRVLDSANKKHMMIHSKHDKIKSYGDLIAKGVELMIERNKENESRRMDKTVHNGNNDNTTPKTTNEPISTIPSPLPVKFIKLECDNVIEETCSNAKSLKKFMCRLDNRKLPLEKLCDGISDCLDKSDEQDCAIQAVGKIRNAGQVISNIESSISRKCFTADMTEPFLSKQNKVLLGVLHTQLKFIEKYTDMSSPADPPNPNKKEIDKETLKKTANEVALVVSSLARALDGSLCARRLGMEDVDELTRKFIDGGTEKALEDIVKEKLWSPQSCDCSGPICSNTTCEELCTRICWQKYSLDRWTCHAIDEGSSISLDLICDGKLDCYDESDELGCANGESYPKFEARSLYDNILKQIGIKTRLKEYRHALTDLITLHESIKLVQKLTTKHYVEIMNVKIARDQCFTTINEIFQKSLLKGDLTKINNIYSFLISLNGMLVGAMKRSGTGNERLISAAPGSCYCTGARCGLPKCSNACIKTCAAEPLLTKYLCGNVKLNTSVPLDAICNGKSNCPNGEDELNCEKDICRVYHLRVLRYKLQNLRQSHKGTGVSETIKSWKTKVTSSLKIAEKNDRPTPQVLKDIISNILHDLLMSYASLAKDFRRTSNRTERALKEFSKISQIVIETLKSCRH